MTYTEKILEEFDIKQRLFLGGRLHSTAFNKWFVEMLTTKINQALAEERSKAWEGEAVKQAYIQGKSHGISEAYERVRGIIREKRKELWQFYHEAQLWEEQKTIVKPLDDLLESLDKLTDKDKFVIEGCKVCGCGKRSEAKGAQGGNGACICSCHSTWNL